PQAPVREGPRLPSRPHGAGLARLPLPRRCRTAARSRAPLFPPGLLRAGPRRPGALPRGRAGRGRQRRPAPADAEAALAVAGDELSPEPPAGRESSGPHGALDAFFGPGGPLTRLLDDYEPRPEQAAMARGVADSLARGRHLLVEAGTGVGKS